jgi:hypothetical protein
MGKILTNTRRVTSLLIILGIYFFPPDAIGGTGNNNPGKKDKDDAKIKFISFPIHFNGHIRPVNTGNQHKNIKKNKFEDFSARQPILAVHHTGITDAYSHHGFAIQHIPYHIKFKVLLL